MDAIPDYPEIAGLLERLGLQHSPAGWHGLVCGALCVDDAARVDVTHLADGDAPVAGDAQALESLVDLRTQAQRALHQVDAPFSPLLPADDVVLAVRTQALVQWCEGFVFSLGARHRLDLAACSSDVREIIHDFTEITRAECGAEVAAEEEEENAYAELVEYVRVGAQLVYVELRRTADDAGALPIEGRARH